MTQRIVLDEYFLRIAFVTAMRSTCPRASVGAVLAYNGRLISIGYNGSPSKTDHCVDAGCVIDPYSGSCRRAVHAEINALLQAQADTKDATLYCTHRPCIDCTKAIINAGVTRIVFGKEYKPHPLALEMLNQAGVIVNYIEMETT